MRSFLYIRSCVNLYCFFFQAEDGIRDRNVTGVQTCALPISFLLTYIRMKDKYFYYSIDFIFHLKASQLLFILEKIIFKTNINLHKIYTFCDHKIGSASCRERVYIMMINV